MTDKINTTVDVSKMKENFDVWLANKKKNLSPQNFISFITTFDLLVTKQIAIASAGTVASVADVSLRDAVGGLVNIGRNAITDIQNACSKKSVKVSDQGPVVASDPEKLEKAIINAGRYLSDRCVKLDKDDCLSYLGYVKLKVAAKTGLAIINTTPRDTVVAVAETSVDTGKKAWSFGKKLFGAAREKTLEGIEKGKAKIEEVKAKRAAEKEAAAADESEEDK